MAYKVVPASEWGVQSARRVDNLGYPLGPHIGVVAINANMRRLARVQAIADAAIEADTCERVNDDPLVRDRSTEAALDAARVELRQLIDAHRDAAPRGR